VPKVHGTTAQIAGMLNVCITLHWVDTLTERLKPEQELSCV
jgi:hypothetical protein